MNALRRWIGPSVIALTAVSLLGSGVSTAGELRDDERKERAARELARAQAAYRDAVRPVIEKVFDHAQPLIEADVQFDDDAVQGYFAWVDVATDPTAGKAIQARRNELKAFSPPPSFTAAAAKLDTGMKLLQEAAVLYQKLPFDPDDGKELGIPAQVALLRFNAGASAVNGAVLDLFEGADKPAVPLRADNTAKPARRPVSKGSYLLQVGRACGRGNERGEAVPEDTDTAEESAKAARDSATILRDAVKELRAATKPPADTAALAKSVDGQLTQFARVADSFDRLALSLDARDPVALNRAFDGLDAGEVPARMLSKTFKSYGSDACALFFEP